MCGGLGEAATHGDDGLAAREYLVSRDAEEIVVVGEACLHARLFDGEEGDEAAFFGGGPDGLGRGEVAELGGADGAGETGRGRQCDLDFFLMGRGGACLEGGLIEPGLEVLHLEVAVDDLEVLFGLVVEVFLELVALVAVVDGFDGLFEGDGDEEADDDGGDVDEEVAPGAGGVVGRVDVEHGVGVLFGGESSVVAVCLCCGAGRVDVGPGWGAGVRSDVQSGTGWLRCKSGYERA